MWTQNVAVSEIDTQIPVICAMHVIARNGQGVTVMFYNLFVDLLYYSEQHNDHTAICSAYSVY